MSFRTRPAGIVAGIALSIVMIVCSSGCSDQPETIPDGPPPTLDAGTDSTTVETDAGTDTSALDICEQQSPPPMGGYTLTEPSWACGQAAGLDHNQWTIQGPVWATTTVVVQPMDSMCGVTIPNYMDSAIDYTNLMIMRASTAGPFRFYWGIPGNPGVEFVCYDRGWVNPGN